LIAASIVRPGVVWEPVGVLEVAAVVVPAGGVAPSPSGVVSPLASPVCVPVLVTEGQAVVALASPVVLAVEPLVETLVLVVEPLVVETLVLVVKALVLEVAVEPVVVVVEGLAVVAAAATMRLLATKEPAKEPGAGFILSRSLSSPPSIAQCVHWAVR